LLNGIPGSLVTQRTLILLGTDDILLLIFVDIAVCYSLPKMASTNDVGVSKKLHTDLEVGLIRISECSLDEPRSVPDHTTSSTSFLVLAVTFARV